MDVKQFRQDTLILHGNNAQNNIKLTDIVPLQHEDLESHVNNMNKINIAQCLCEPYAVCASNNPSNGAYVATCVNFPDFSLSVNDGQGNSYNLIGMKVRVMFNYGITYGSVSGGTYPTLNINNSGAIPMLAQGKLMAKGAISAGQTVEFTIIPYGNSLAFDADSNVREATSDYTIYTDGTTKYQSSKVDSLLAGKLDRSRTHTNTSSVSISVAGNATYLVTASEHSDYTVGVSSSWIVHTCYNATKASIVKISDNKIGSISPITLTYDSTNKVLVLTRTVDVDWYYNYCKLI